MDSNWTLNAEERVLNWFTVRPDHKWIWSWV